MTGQAQVVLSWSGGKDSALALVRLAASADLRVAALLTTVTAEYDRVSVHGVRREVLDAQAAGVGLPLEIARLPAGGSNEAYESAFGGALEGLRARGIGTVAYGDLHLEDVRAYREGLSEAAGMRPLFPLWGEPTDRVAAEVVARGFRAVTTCVDGEALGPSFVGREYDAGFLQELPSGVDPCGENGEFHTFVHTGPVLQRPVPVRTGRVVRREGRFWYCDLLL